MLAARPGYHAPLGATWDGEGTNFAVFSEHARAVELCLFDAEGRETRVPLHERTLHVFHAYLPGVGPGQRYGFRAHGAWEPAEGRRFNAAKLLVDPYARALEGKVDYRYPVFAYPRDLGASDLVRDDRDSARGVPKSVVVDDTFDWKGDRPPRVPWTDTVLYEAHVKGLTARHPRVPPEHRGTYLGVAADAVVEHLRALGVTTVELLPIHDHMDEWFVASRGSANYWGYSSLGYFAPDQRFASAPGQQVTEFKEMVRRLHAAGLEVVLDVVYNHTGEGDHTGPSVGLRGLDNEVYYRLRRDDRRRYEDFTGCGNTLNMVHAQTLKLVMDSLRYWVTEMHVDGFRFDLASALARESLEVDKLSAFFDIVHQDPVLSRVKLIAEPWDLGEGGYQVGNFPVLWTEWNGRYRDTTRRFWRGERTAVPDLGFRLTGSSDLYEEDGRHPTASINFVTAHDGFTLRDLVTYERKRNEDNGEDNRDGTDDNLAWNSGAEGETDDAAVRALRLRRAKAFLLTLAVSQGVPMLVAGDEMGRTQRGNNNAYCQDTPLSWVDWDLDPPREELLAFARQVLAFRARHPVLRRRRFLRGAPVGGSELKDIAWFSPEGEEMTDADWASPRAAALGLLLAGDALGWEDDEGKPVVDDTLLVVLSAERAPLPLTLPDERFGLSWLVRFDTARPERVGETLVASTQLVLEPSEALVLRRTEPRKGAWSPSVARVRSARRYWPV